MKKPILEKQVVDHIIKNWDKFFGEEQIKFFRREKSPVSWLRSDLWGTIDMELQELGYTDYYYPYRASIFIEVKYNSESRDLIYELSKGLELISRISWPNYLGVISDDFSDPAILKFIKENNIHMWKVNIKDNDIETMTLRYVTPGEETGEDILERM